jgi:hypothetical protein
MTGSLQQPPRRCRVHIWSGRASRRDSGVISRRHFDQTSLRHAYYEDSRETPGEYCFSLANLARDVDEGVDVSERMETEENSLLLASQGQTCNHSR